MVRDLATRSMMEGMLEQWRSSGKSGADYARSNGMTPSKFYYWKKLLDSGGPKSKLAGSRASKGLVPVRVLSGVVGQRGSGGVEVVLSGGDRLVFGEEVSEEVLRRVVRVLRESC